MEAQKTPQGVIVREENIEYLIVEVKKMKRWQTLFAFLVASQGILIFLLRSDFNTKMSTHSDNILEFYRAFNIMIDNFNVLNEMLIGTVGIICG